MYIPRLRVLLDPVYISIANLNGSSTYAKFHNIAKELVSRGHFVYWMVPDAKYEPSELEDHQNIAIIRTTPIQDQFIADGLVTNEFFTLFNRLAGKYHIDAIVTGRTSLALYYKRLLEAPRYHDNKKNFTDKAYGIPTVIIEEFPQTRSTEATGEAYSMMQCQGYLGADCSIFLSAHNREEITEEMLNWFRTSVVNDWTKRTRIIPSGINCDELDQKYVEDTRWEAEKGFQVVSIGRIFGSAYLEQIPWFDYLYRSGMTDTTLTISLSGTLSGPMRHKLEKIGYDLRNNSGRQLIVREKNPRNSFLKMLRRFHAFIAPVKHLDHPTAIFEALFLGVPGIIPVSDYQRDFFPDYPFVVDPKDKDAFIAAILSIKENPRRARDMVAGWRQIIRDKYNSKDSIADICNQIEVVGRDYVDRFKTSSSIIKFCRELKGEIYTFPDVVAYLRKKGYLGISIGDMSIRQTFTYAKGAIHHTLRYVGYVDDCTNAEERFVRRDVFDKMVSEVHQNKIKKRVSKVQTKQRRIAEQMQVLSE